MASEKPYLGSVHRLKLEIVTPENLVFSEWVDSLIAPGISGELCILPSHCPLITMLQPGELRIIKKGEELLLAIGGGFLEVKQNGIVILADIVERAENIDAQKAEEAKQRAEQRLSERQISAFDKAAAEAALRLELTRLRVAQKRKKKKKDLIDM
jgi:F-type H+-transporting ATPase subunit epsilon